MASSKKKVNTISTEKPPRSIDNRPFYGMILDEEQKTFVNAILNPDIDIVFCNARAGTGKTTMATGAANILVQTGCYSNIIYIMTPYGEKKQGWLPGTLTEKSAVYFEAFYQALITCNVNPNTAINDESMVNQKNGTGYVTCITDTYLRGVNLDDAVVIIDESQNATIPQLKKILTRIGTKSKVIVIGHDKQCDLDWHDESGFLQYINHFEGKERCAVCSLSVNHRGWISQWADEL